jgi:hypothetical protein
VARGGSQLLALHGNSLLAALQAAYPEAAFDARVACARVPRGFWDSRRERERFVEEVAREHCVSTAADWAHVTAADVAEMGGSGLLGRYGNSLGRLLADVRPSSLAGAALQDGALAFAARPDRTAGYWLRPSHRRRFMEEAGLRLSAVTLAEWLRVRPRQLRQLRGGHSFLEHHGGSMLAALHAHFPAEDWAAEAFVGRVPDGYWRMREHRSAFLRHVMAKCGVEGLDDWRKVSSQDVVDLGGAGFLARYGNSLLAALQDLLPGMGHDAAKITALRCRSVAPDDYWLQQENLRSFFDGVKGSLGIEHERDWLRVSRSQLQELGCRSMLAKMSLQQALALAYPTQRWEWMARQTGGRKTQRLMRLQLGNLFGCAQAPPAVLSHNVQ